MSGSVKYRRCVCVKQLLPGIVVVRSLRGSGGIYCLMMVERASLYDRREWEYVLCMCVCVTLDSPLPCRLYYHVTYTGVVTWQICMSKCWIFDEAVGATHSSLSLIFLTCNCFFASSLRLPWWITHTYTPFVQVWRWYYGCWGQSSSMFDSMCVFTFCCWEFDPSSGL